MSKAWFDHLEIEVTAIQCGCFRADLWHTLVTFGYHMSHLASGRSRLDLHLPGFRKSAEVQLNEHFSK
jgi:hypothetical protein